MAMQFVVPVWRGFVLRMVNIERVGGTLNMQAYSCRTQRMQTRATPERWTPDISRQ